MDVPCAEPRVSLAFPDFDDVNLLLRMPIPADRKGITEREIRHRYMETRQQSNHTTGTGGDHQQQSD